MAGYQKRLTSAHINAMVAAETVNQLVDLSGTFDPARENTVWVGDSETVDMAVFGEGLYSVKTGTTFSLIRFKNGSDSRAYDGWVKNTDGTIEAPTTVYILQTGVMQAIWHGTNGSRKIKEIRKVG